MSAKGLTGVSQNCCDDRHDVEHHVAGILRKFHCGKHYFHTSLAQVRGLHARMQAHTVLPAQLGISTQ